MELVIGTAGWSIAQRDAASFPAEGSSLERYAARFGGAEINSSFHRPHRQSTWARWAASVPEGFRFSVKLPKTITHQLKLADFHEPLRAHIADASELGGKLAVHLVQLPPSLVFEAHVADSFFGTLSDLAEGAAVACEPRHASWFGPEAEDLLVRRGVARVAADPAKVEAAAKPGGAPTLSYFRLHGSPVTYRSSYRDGRIEAWAEAMAAAPGAVWCIFDNTASSQATGDALVMMEVLAAHGKS
jgi:uncharacterized protein YecE (DUF72 family)